MAIQEMYTSKIPASITLAQGLLESGAGRSTLAMKANNHFGIKCHSSWTGKTMHRKDDDRNRHGKLIESCFRKYDDPSESYADHSDFLTGSRRYAPLFLLHPTDYKGWARGLKKAGYATSSTYATKLIGLIETYQLYQFDEGSNATDYMLAGTEVKVSEATAERVIEAPTDQSPALSGASILSSSASTTLDRPKLASKGRVHVNNDVEYTFVASGEDLGDIARRTRSYSSELVKYNEGITYVIAPLEQGTRIYLQPKRKSFRGRQKTHFVKRADSMQAIADQYGIQTNWLYKRNNMEAGTEPKAGETIYLRGHRGKKKVVKLRKAKSSTSTYTRTKVKTQAKKSKPTSSASKKARKIQLPSKVFPTKKSTSNSTAKSRTTEIRAGKVKPTRPTATSSAIDKIRNIQLPSKVFPTKRTTTNKSAKSRTTKNRTESNKPKIQLPSKVFPAKKSTTINSTAKSRIESSMPIATNSSAAKRSVDTQRSSTATSGINKTKKIQSPSKVFPTKSSTATSVITSSTPTRRALTSSEVENTARYVTVQSGETLWRIGNREGITVADLRSLNGLESNTIHVGTRLRVR